jgi:hypothetical protein
MDAFGRFPLPITFTQMHLTAADMIGGTDHILCLHKINNPSRAIVADA